jgi:hypothetical protein
MADFGKSWFAFHELCGEQESSVFKPLLFIEPMRLYTMKCGIQLYACTAPLSSSLYCRHQQLRANSTPAHGFVNHQLVNVRQTALLPQAVLDRQRAESDNATIFLGAYVTLDLAVDATAENRFQHTL